MRCSLSGRLVAIGACFDLGEDYNRLGPSTARRVDREHTLQTINSPLLELFKGDLSRWRRVVQIQPIRIVLLLVRRRSELPFLGVDRCSTLRVDSMSVLSDHDFSCAELCDGCPLSSDFNIGDERDGSLSLNQEIG